MEPLLFLFVSTSEEDGHRKAPYRAAWAEPYDTEVQPTRLLMSILKRLRSIYSRAGRIIRLWASRWQSQSQGRRQPSSGGFRARSAASYAPANNKSVCRSPGKPYRFAVPT